MPAMQKCAHYADDNLEKHQKYIEAFKGQRKANDTLENKEKFSENALTHNPSNRWAWRSASTAVDNTIADCCCLNRAESPKESLFPLVSLFCCNRSGRTLRERRWWAPEANAFSSSFKRDSFPISQKIFRYDQTGLFRPLISTERIVLSNRRAHTISKLLLPKNYFKTFVTICTNQKIWKTFSETLSNINQSNMNADRVTDELLKLIYEYADLQHWERVYLFDGDTNAGALKIGKQKSWVSSKIASLINDLKLMVLFGWLSVWSESRLSVVSLRCTVRMPADNFDSFRSFRSFKMSIILCPISK